MRSTRSVILLGLVFSFQCAYAQSLKKPREYFLKLKLTNGVERKGTYAGATDSSLLVIGDFKKGIPVDSTRMEIPSNEIVTISYRNKKSVNTGAVLGTLAGAIVALIVYPTPNEPCNTVGNCLDDVDEAFSETLKGMGIIVTGGALGALIGLTTREFIIHGDATNFQSFHKIIESSRARN